MNNVISFENNTCVLKNRACGVPYVWLGGVAVGRRIRDREVASSIPGCSPLGATLGKLFTHVCLCSPSSINWYRLRLGVKCTTGAMLGMLAAIIGGPCSWRPTGATPASFLPVVAVVQRP